VSDAIVGIDLGGTKLAAASLRGHELGDSVIEHTELSDGDALLEQIVALVGKADDEHPAAVGIGVPSVVEFATGRVVSSVNIPLRDVPLREVLGERLGVPVFVDNDATVAALAEAHDSELQLVARNLVMLTVGTGVGGGIVIGGRIFRGATGGAGELGHTLVGLDVGRSVALAAEKFPQAGSLEYVAAGHALDHLASECASQHADSTLGRLVASGKKVLGADAVAAAYDGDADAADIVALWGERLGIGIANAINTFDPDEVVIGGGAARAGELLLEPARKVALGYVVPGLRGTARIRLAWHGVRAGVLGAALLAAQELELGSSGVDSGAASVSADAGVSST